MQEPGIGIVSRFWQNVFNEGQLETMDTLLASNYVLHDLATKIDHNREDLTSVLRDVQTQLPGTHARIEEHLAAGEDRVVSRITFRAPASPDYSSAQGTPAPALEWREFSGISISRVTNHQIAETWILWEAIRAEMELQPADTNWRWPPWR